MSLSTYYTPLYRRYYDYLDEPILWNRYQYSTPVWVCYKDEYERMRSSLSYMEDRIDEMIAKARETLKKTSESTSVSSYVPSSTYVSTYVPEYVPEYVPYVSSLTSYDLESEIAAWKSAMSAMHTTMYDVRSRTETMGSRIASLTSDADRTYTLKREFDIDSMLSEMEVKRRSAEDVCSRIYDALNIPKPDDLFVGRYYSYRY